MAIRLYGWQGLAWIDEWMKLWVSEWVCEWLCRGGAYIEIRRHVSKMPRKSHMFLSGAICSNFQMSFSSTTRGLSRIVSYQISNYSKDRNLFSEIKKEEVEKLTFLALAPPSPTTLHQLKTNSEWNLLNPWMSLNSNGIIEGVQGV